MALAYIAADIDQGRAGLVNEIMVNTTDDGMDGSCADGRLHPA